MRPFPQSVFGAVGFLCAAAATCAEDQVYWSDAGRGVIERSSLDGSHRVLLIQGIAPSGIAVDGRAGLRYWAECARAGIRRSFVHRSEIETLVTSHLYRPTDIELDLAGGRMYWSDYGGTIGRANLDGGNMQILYMYSGVLPAGLALDVPGGMIYWTDQMTQKIWRGPIDGGVGQVLIGTGLYEPTDIELDLAAQKMYWTDVISSSIARANLDGSNVEYVFVAAVIAPFGLGLDAPRQWLYFTDPRTLRVLRADFKGTQVETLIGGELVKPAGLALCLAPGGAIPGDLNCDGLVNFGDINPFVLALTNPAAWQAQYPNCPYANGDINADGRVDFGDINPFVALLSNP